MGAVAGPVTVPRKVGESRRRSQVSLSPDSGHDPIFRTNDGSNCDHNIDTSDVEGRRKAYSLLLNQGLIRIAIATPQTAEFQVVSVVNPYGCSDTMTLSMYRRPLPSTNLRGRRGERRVGH
jgi:cytochrome c peroxidase